MLSDFKLKFMQNFIEQGRWKLLANGLLTTLQVTFFAVLIGIFLGFVIAVIRAASDKTGKMKILNLICKAYLTVIRGTPVLVQLMIIYFVIFASSSNKVLAAVLAFGLNSAAYVAEIVRSGIMSVDSGQFEAGRSLGFNYSGTMWYIVIPQAFKNVLPALANEFIVLLKETSVSAMVGLSDLTYGGNLIRSRTYEAFFPLLAVAIIYLIIVVFLSWGVSLLERRLRGSER
jgi:His/Glu/Gln/Arg/opine family amino acid ABC transporter permease subunit